MLTSAAKLQNLRAHGLDEPFAAFDTGSAQIQTCYDSLIVDVDLRFPIPGSLISYRLSASLSSCTMLLG